MVMMHNLFAAHISLKMTTNHQNWNISQPLAAAILNEFEVNSLMAMVKGTF